MQSLKIAATGMAAQQMRVDVISNNLANMSTTGYNARRADTIATALLCSDFLSVDINVDVNLDLSDPEAVANAVLENDACATCPPQPRSAVVLLPRLFPGLRAAAGCARRRVSHGDSLVRGVLPRAARRAAASGRVLRHRGRWALLPRRADRCRPALPRSVRPVGSTATSTKPPWRRFPTMRWRPTRRS